MSDRSYHRPETQGIRHVTYNFSIKWVAGSPVFQEGDAAGLIAGSYLTMVDTGVGNALITTNDPFAGVVSITGSRQMATPTGDAMLTFGLPTQLTNGRWQFSVRTWTNAAGTISAADPPAGDFVSVTLVLRNSAVKP